MTTSFADYSTPDKSLACELTAKADAALTAVIDVAVEAVAESFASDSFVG